MNTRIAAVGAVVLLLIVGGAAAFVTGVGPFPGGDNGEDLEGMPESTGTVYDEDGDSGSGDGSGDAGSGDGSGDTGPPFAFKIEKIEKCGTTCRDVTATITNRQSEQATGVTVYTQIFAGNTTAEADRVWSGKQDVGTLAADGGASTSTKRVKLSFSEARKVQSNDGWITVVTTVESADGTITFESRRDVI